MANYYLKNIKFNRKALKEVYEIINDYDEEELGKIPLEVQGVIKDNMDKDYKFNLDDFEVEKLDEVNLHEDTKKILTYLYTNYLATEEEKDLINKIENVQLEKLAKKKEKSSNKLFDTEIQTEKINKEIKEELLPVIKQKENFFGKFKAFIKKYFN